MCIHFMHIYTSYIHICFGKKFRPVVVQVMVLKNLPLPKLLISKETLKNFTTLATLIWGAHDVITNDLSDGQTAKTLNKTSVESSCCRSTVPAYFFVN